MLMNGTDRARGRLRNCPTPGLHIGARGAPQLDIESARGPLDVL